MNRPGTLTARMRTLAASRSSVRERLTTMLFLTALWEWLKLAEVDDTLARTILLLCNVAVMAALGILVRFLF